MSDIFGETVDQLNQGEAIGNGNGNSPPDLDSAQLQRTPRTPHPWTCTIYSDKVGTDNSTRWLLGEGLYAPDLDHPIRDMYYSECFGYPSTTYSDQVQYFAVQYSTIALSRVVIYCVVYILCCNTLGCTALCCCVVIHWDVLLFVAVL